MNAKTAKHLNDLLDASQPVTLIPQDPAITHYYERIVTGPVTSGLAGKLQQAIVSHTQRAIEDEIAWAATNRRSTRDIDAECEPNVTGAIRLHGGVPWHRYELALPELRAIIAAHNAETLARYEAYRLACEQRVAVPPENGDK